MSFLLIFAKFFKKICKKKKIENRENRFSGDWKGDGGGKEEGPIFYTDKKPQELIDGDFENFDDLSENGKKGVFGGSRMTLDGRRRVSGSLDEEEEEKMQDLKNNLENSENQRYSIDSRLNENRGNRARHRGAGGRRRGIFWYEYLRKKKMSWHQIYQGMAKNLMKRRESEMNEIKERAPGSIDAQNRGFGAKNEVLGKSGFVPFSSWKGSNLGSQKVNRGRKARNASFFKSYVEKGSKN